MIDESTREHVISVVQAVPERTGNLDVVMRRGRRRRVTRNVASIGGVAALVAVGAVVTAMLMPGRNQMVADVSQVTLMDGVVVDVVGGPVESHGALVYQGALGPVPLFDTASLGTEVALTAKPASELVIPTSSNPLEGNSLRASQVVYLGDIHGAQIALHVFSDGTRDQLCVYLGNGTEVAGAGSCRVPGGPITDNGTVDPPIGSWAVWTYVPEGTAVVHIVLDDGSSYWQRPTAGTVFLNLDDGRPLGYPSFYALDQNGRLLEAVGQSKG